VYQLEVGWQMSGLWYPWAPADRREHRVQADVLRFIAMATARTALPHTTETLTPHSPITPPLHYTPQGGEDAGTRS
jgi:hypothetical protein